MKNIWKVLLLVTTVIFLYSSALAQQQGSKKSEKKFQLTWLAVDILPVSTKNTNEYSPEYGWKAGDYFAGGGFIEFGKNRPLFGRQNIRIRPTPKQFPFLSFRTEVAFNKHGVLVQAGPQFELTQVPKLRKPLKKALRGLSVTPMSKFVGNIGTRNETLVIWNTQKARIGSVLFWSEGFERFRGGGRKDFGQWQAWVQFPKLSKHVAFGTEVEHQGGNRIVPMFGVKIFK